MPEHHEPEQQSGEATVGQTSPSREDLGSLSIEDDESGTHDPADLAGTADGTDEGLGPSVSEAD